MPSIANNPDSINEMHNEMPIDFSHRMENNGNFFDNVSAILPANPQNLSIMPAPTHE